MLNAPQQRLRTWLRTKEAWCYFRHAQREHGLRFIFERLWHCPRILKTRPLRTEAHTPGEAVAVHMLCWRRDWQMALWALKSFYHHARVHYPLTLHLQSTLSESARRHLRRHLPDARIISRAEADEKVSAHLKSRGLNRCLALRHAEPMGFKLTDFQILGDSTNLVAFDTDVLFYRKPVELLTADDHPISLTLFQQDYEYAYGLPLEQARQESGVNLAPLLNTGVVLRARQDLDLNRIEHFLGRPSISAMIGWREQTLHSLCACELGRVAMLPESYALGAGKMDCSKLVCRHYVTPTRGLFVREGIPHLCRQGFLKSF